MYEHILKAQSATMDNTIYLSRRYNVGEFDNSDVAINLFSPSFYDCKVTTK